MYYTGKIYLLKLLTIFNLGTTLYIFNNLSYFYNFRKALRHKYIIASSSEVPILGYSNVTIQVTKPNKSKGILCLKDVAFYTDFNTNLISFRLLQKQWTKWFAIYAILAYLVINISYYTLFLSRDFVNRIYAFTISVALGVLYEISLHRELQWFVFFFKKDYMVFIGLFVGIFEQLFKWKKKN